MNTLRLQELFERYYNKTASAAERLELMQLIKETPAEQLADLIRKSGDNMDIADYNLPAETANAMLQKILQPDGIYQILPLDQFSEKGKSGQYGLLKKISVAASILLISGAAFYFFFNTKTHTRQPVVSQQLQDVRPGSYKAKLKLADGSTIILDSTPAGKLAQQNNTTIISRNGQLVYSDASSTVVKELIFNTLTTNNGETYALVLADGSKVWLNAASSISFPVAFAGKDRRVAITGEVYIEVAKNAKQPFIVSVNNMEVKALGTEFNINAYRDEATMNTTLINGSVEVSSSAIDPGAESAILKPGQQAAFSNTGITIQSIDTYKVIAWKEGRFDFENTDLKTILRQFSRWYDVEVVYEGPITDRKFFGIVNRSNELPDVLEMLKDNNIKFRVEGRKLYVISD